MEQLGELEIRGVRFQPLRKLGKGSFGVVYEVEHFGERKALKVIREEAKQGINSLKELDILTRLRHPGLAHADEIISEYRPERNEVETFVIMPLAQSDLHKAIGSSRFSYGEKLQVLTNVTKGLVFLHDQNYLHMDIKPLNILVYNNFQSGKLSDFGLSLRLEGDREKYKKFPVSLMTITHRSINILTGSRVYTEADDIWSLGMTFLETFSGSSIFTGFKKPDYTKERVTKVILDKLGPNSIDKTLNKYFKKVPPLFKSKLIKIVKMMLQIDPLKRPSAKQVLAQMTTNTKIGGEVLPTQVLPPALCDALVLEGYNAMIKLCSKIWCKLETFFLAADIYQRSLAYRHPLTGDLQKDIDNSIFQGVLAVYMAIKVIEDFSGKSTKLAELTDNRFDPNDLVLGESHLVTGFEGHIYRNNLFTGSSTEKRFREAFEISRNCKVYRKIDMEKWAKMDKQEAAEGDKKYGLKWGYFSDFLEKMDYTDVVYADPPVDLSQIYANDPNF